MNLIINKKRLVLGLEWANCLVSDKENVVAEFKNRSKKQFVCIKGDNSEVAVGATEQDSGYSAAALLAIERHDALCVLTVNDEYWVSLCIDGHPVSDKIIPTTDEAAAETRSIMGVIENVQIIGNKEFFSEFFPDTKIEETDWKDLVDEATKDALRTARTAKSASLIIQYLILLILVIVIVVLFWPPAPESELEQKQIKWNETHKIEESQIKLHFANTLKNDPATRIAAYMAVVLKLPVQVSAWMIEEIACTDLTCIVTWAKQDASGTFAEFDARRDVLFNPDLHLSLSAQYSKSGDKIVTNIALKPDNAFTGVIGNLLLKEQFFTEGLHQMQTAQKTKLIAVTIETENLGPRQTPSPDGRQFESLQYSYGSWLMTGKGILTIPAIAKTLKPNLFSVSQLLIKPNVSTMTTWELRGSYAYK